MMYDVGNSPDRFTEAPLRSCTSRLSRGEKEEFRSRVDHGSS